MIDIFFIRYIKDFLWGLSPCKVNTGRQTDIDGNSSRSQNSDALIVKNHETGKKKSMTKDTTDAQ